MMNRSESIKNISVAVLKAQKNIGAASKGASNPFFKSKYANLGSVMEACKEALNNEGITVLQPVASDASGEYVDTVLLHESGEFISSRMKLMATKNMQELGSATSYARRYGLQSMMFIPAEDDDSEATMNRAPKNRDKTPEESLDVSKSAVVVVGTGNWRKNKTLSSSPVPNAEAKLIAAAQAVAASDEY